MPPKRKAVIPYARGYKPPTEKDIQEATGQFPLLIERKTESGALVQPVTTIPVSVDDINIQSYYTCQPCDFKAFKPVPNLSFEGDWLAIENEDHQPFQTYDRLLRRRSGAFSYVTQGSPTLLDRTTIYLLPIVLDSIGWPAWGPDLNALREYMSTFFGVYVEVLDFSMLSLHLPPEEKLETDGKIITFQKPDGTGSTKIQGRYHRETTHVQLYMDDISSVLKKIFSSKCYLNMNDVGNAMIIVGVTCVDLYCEGKDSLFTAGMAYIREKVSILSFSRYHPYMRMSGMHWYEYGYASTATESPYFDDDKKRPKDVEPRVLNDAKWKIEYFRRAAKLVLHETCHLFFLMHCTYFHCLMNGTGHLIEDYAAPSHLCPVCLRKLQLKFAFNVLERYRKLQEIYAKFGLKGEVIWTQKLLADLRKASSHSSSTLTMANTIVIDDEL